MSSTPDSTHRPRTAAHPAPESPWRARREQRRDHALKRDAVIRAAARAFSERGYHNTSLDDIAAALDVTKPTIYYYVENKEQLLFQCFLAGLELIRAGLAETGDATRPGRERLAIALRRYAEAVASDFGWCMVQTEEQDLSPEMSRHIKSLKREIDHDIRSLIQQGVRDGSIRECDPKMMAFAMAGAINWITHWYRENQALSPKEVADAFIALFEQGLMPRG